ncbi:hypothetical protein QKU48_gp0147 [Fadolivirus algeromassiliense]|jgi:hypothetical protein|uniref:Uncharacterized protein n=1 Tax=Fadolivirus FV1/VV64 TaxID=3070911 RepID=A0A7D3QTU1_9VIRU|nr:hypothetical protein QKU48_gp0147 [Fadolivirus algeromassiliense]QKF93605.1 hypothetical protein Fadolivirus_1_147 [Fadolivirus FV1/VV64]
MFWEILLSNLITTIVVGGGILSYHLYRQYKEQQYYTMVKQKLTDSLMAVSQGLLYYFALKGTIDLNQIKSILGSHPILKEHFPLHLSEFAIPPVNPLYDTTFSHDDLFKNSYPKPCTASQFPHCKMAQECKFKKPCSFILKNNDCNNENEYTSEQTECELEIPDSEVIKKVSI